MGALTERLTFEPRGVELEALPWPTGLEPKPIKYNATPLTALPKADVLVVTWTSAEWMALADVLTPGIEKRDWLRYAENWHDYEGQLTDKSPARDANCLAEYCLTQIGTKRVLCVHSELHLATDGITAPIVQLWSQMIREVLPELVITTGTAGGIGTQTVLGDVFVVSTGKFNCTQTFAEKPWAQARFEQAAPVGGQAMRYANTELIVVNAHQLPAALTPQEPQIVVSAGSVETVDYFGFADTGDRYGIVKNDPTAHTEEMDDCTLPLALAAIELNRGKALPWLSIRNASDPQVPTSIGDLEAQKRWASNIYEKYGYWTTVGSAIACWAVIADLP
jgi:nucleoside phosphorylase